MKIVSEKNLHPAGRERSIFEQATLGLMAFGKLIFIQALFEIN